MPKTKLNINVDVVKTAFYKGPFSEYAKEYLGIENVIENNSTEYKLSNIDIVPTVENDNYYTYLLTNYSKNINTFSYFEGTNVISALNTSTDEPEIAFINKDFNNETGFVPFKDRTVKPLVIEKSDTVWKTILVDSVYKRIPKVNTAIAPRTVKEQAYMASRFILKIRKRRLRILTGMDRKYPTGNTLKKIISELLYVTELLKNRKNLPKKYQDHQLKGKLKSFRECHIFPDFLLVYEIEKDLLILSLIRMGSHSEIFA